MPGPGRPEPPKRPWGVGLRPAHYPRILSGAPPKVGWFEAVSENYMDSEGRPLAVLEEVRARFPVALHGVSMNIGAAEGPGGEYLRRLRRLADRLQPFLVTDHLCWTGPAPSNLHDLLPLPRTREALDHVVRQVERVQEALGRTIALENVSAYLELGEPDFSEPEFLSELCRRAGCGLLVDVNNVYVSGRNLGFDPSAWLEQVPAERVAQLHLGGHVDLGTHLFDTHSRPVPDPVWELYARFSERLGEVPVLIEWDEDLPPFEELERQAALAERAWRGGRLAPCA